MGLFVGAATFFIGDLLIERRGGQRKSATGPGSSSSASAIVLGTILDGIPESIVLGLTILSREGLSIAMLVAVFLSNLPEAMSSTAGFLASETPRSRILWLWLFVVLVSGLSSMLGYSFFGDSSRRRSRSSRASPRGDPHDAGGHDDARGVRERRPGRRALRRWGSRSRS